VKPELDCTWRLQLLTQWRLYILLSQSYDKCQIEVAVHWQAACATQYYSSMQSFHWLQQISFHAAASWIRDKLLTTHTHLIRSWYHCLSDALDARAMCECVHAASGCRQTPCLRLV
jgi:hypothetical protein